MYNKAAWLNEAKQRPFVISDAPMPTLNPNQITVRVRATAINPCDAGMQSMGLLLTAYPAILGVDMAGEVAAVGTEVTRFSVGDRVVALNNTIEDPASARGSFQLFCATNENLATKLPDNISFTEASVLPLGLYTAAMGLYSADNLGLPVPQLDPKPSGGVLLVWGASSSVGSCAVQLAVASGYEVIATAGEHNLEYCKALGAAQVFDHRSKTVVEDIVLALKARAFAGVYNAILTPETTKTCGEIAHQVDGRKFVVTVAPARSFLPKDLQEDVQFGVGKLSNRAECCCGIVVLIIRHSVIYGSA